jgi:Sigma-54 interaction domain
MHQTSSVPVTVDFDGEWSALRRWTAGSALEWRAISGGRANLLLEGPEESTDAALLLLRRSLRGIVYWKRRTAPLEIPSVKARTVVVEEIDTLQAAEQSTLLTWTADTDETIRVVSTTTIPLYPLVARGLFDERLYYRLNTIFLRIE